MRARRTASGIALAALAAAAAFGVVTGIAPTSAAWTDAEYTKATTTGVTPVAPTGVSCPTLGLLSGGIPVSWTAPAGTPPSRYTITWSRTGSTTGSTTSTTTSTTIPPAGFALLQTWDIRVYSDYGTWQSASSGVRQVTIVLSLGSTSYACL